MKPTGPAIPTFNITEVNADLGQEKSNNQIHIYTIDNLVYTEKMFRPRRSDHFNISLVTAGEMQVKFNLIDYHLKKNDLFVIPPGIVNQIVTKQDFRAITIGFSIDFLGKAGIHKKNIDTFSFFSSQSSPHLFLNEQEANSLNMLMLLLNEKDLPESNHPFRQEVILHGFNMFVLELAALFKKYRENEPVKVTQKENIIMSFTRMLAQHFKEKRSVQYYADSLFITPKHLTRTIKELTNKTAGELIDEMVITEAKVLLDDLSMSVANVADALNFSDQFFFSKFFKRHTGVSPSEFKSTL